MKKVALLLLVLSAVFFGMAYAEPIKAFEVYVDGRSPENHYISSGWMGDYGDIKQNDQFSQNPHSGSSCIEFVYSAKKSQGQGWAGVYWQNPAQNWGSKKGGFDLTGMTKVTFWARGGKGGEVIQKLWMAVQPLRQRLLANTEERRKRMFCFTFCPRLICPIIK